MGATVSASEIGEVGFGGLEFSGTGRGGKKVVGMGCGLVLTSVKPPPRSCSPLIDGGGKRCHDHGETAVAVFSALLDISFCYSRSL